MRVKDELVRAINDLVSRIDDKDSFDIKVVIEFSVRTPEKNENAEK
jgi:hypothetical protein